MLEPQNNSPVFAIAHLSLSHLCLYILHAFIVHLYMLDISCAQLIYILGLFVCSHLYSIKKVIVAPHS